MTTHIALLRAINVAGHKMVAMADLRDLLTQLGFLDSRSLLQSGNLVFSTRGKTTAQLERLLEAEADRRLGLQTDFFVRTAEEWKAIIAGNTFRREAKDDPGHLLVAFMKDERDPAVLQAAITGREVVRANGRHLYIVYPDGVGRSRLTNALIEKKLATRITGRNWNTVLKLGHADG